MSCNFYFVLTWNLQHPKLAGLLEQMKIYSMSDSLVDLKSRSKHYVSLAETIAHASFDVEKKIRAIYGEGEHVVKQFMMMNPDLSLGLVSSNSGWDRNCAASIYFVEAETIDGEEENDHDSDGEPILPKTWMFKYEIFFFNDKIDVIKNGEQLFSAVHPHPGGASSTYH